MDKSLDKIAEAIEALTEEVRKLRENIESWDEIPPMNDDDPSKYIL